MQNNLKIKTKPEDIPETLREALWILFKLRYHSKKWQNEYGSKNKERMNEWEERADEFIEKVISKEKSE